MEEGILMSMITKDVHELYKQDMINFGLWVAKRRGELDISLDDLSKQTKM
jgi:hypothetical protein